MRPGVGGSFCQGRSETEVTDITSPKTRVTTSLTPRKRVKGWMSPLEACYRDGGGAIELADRACQSRRLTSWVGTTMPQPRLPQEITDYIVDLLQDEHKTLKQCYLVSKLWAPRARRHIFKTITFESPADPAAWTRTFPDISPILLVSLAREMLLLRL